VSLPDRPRSSLRRTLLAWLILPLLLLVPLSAAVLYRLAVRPALDGLDRALTDTAVALTGILEVHDGVATLPLSEQTMHALHADLVDEVAFAVGDARGDHLLGGDAALLALKPATMARGQWHFFDATLRGRAMRVAAFGAACGVPGAVCPILVAESLLKRQEAERSIGIASLAAALLLAASLAVLALLAVRRGLRPLLRAAALMESRSLQRLEPLPLSSVPREVAPFVLALNDLFARLQVAASAQRAFVEDAAHQLRTPLATLRVESSQALARPHPPELRPTLERLQAAAERGAHLAQQLLTLARAEGATLGADALHQRVDLAALASAAADDWLHPSLAAGQDLGFDLQPAAVHGDALLLREMLGNLVHNAILHAGPGAHVTVRTRSADGQAVLEVEDDGQGIPAAELDAVWQRFHRGSGATGLGSGLGLAIVRDIARLHHGEARLQPGPGGRGIVARVSLPADEAVTKLS
jgi:two-component system sensor histidine kinase TctE